MARRYEKETIIYRFSNKIPNTWQLEYLVDRIVTETIQKNLSEKIVQLFIIYKKSLFVQI